MSDHEPSGHVEKIAGILASVIGRMGTLAQTDPQLRELFAQLGHSLIALTSKPPPEAVEPSEPQPPQAEFAVVEQEPAGQASQGYSPEETSAPPQVSAREPLPPITLGMSFAPQALPEPSAIHSAETDSFDVLPEIVKRCRLKAEACRWAAGRNRSLNDPSDASTEFETPDDLIARAKALPNCYLWMCQRGMHEAGDAAQLDLAAACFENCADAAALLHDDLEAGESISHEAFLERALDAAAEAQSMLRVCVASLTDVRDTDQKQLFELLRGVGHRKRVYIRRYMRLEDPADVGQAPLLRERIQALREESMQHDKRDKQRRQAFNKLRYHLNRVQKDGDRASRHDWQSVISAIELVLEEVPPSNVELRELLLPFAEAMPEFVAENAGVQRVLYEIDRYIASRPQAEEWTPRERPTEAVLQVANLLAGRSILLIGGERRPGAKEALEKAFHLRELVWMKTREHNTRIDFDPDVSRPDVAVVILAIRWSRHSFGEVEPVCRQYNKPLVRLPAGYHPNQVAEQIMAQCSERLSRLATLKSSA